MKMRIFYVNRSLTTSIEIEFDAICPIPDPQRAYCGTLVVEYRSAIVLDFNEVQEKVFAYIAGGSRTVEDIVGFAYDLVVDSVGRDQILFIRSTVRVPKQEGHLKVEVTAGPRCPQTGDW